MIDQATDLVPVALSRVSKRFQVIPGGHIKRVSGSFGGDQKGWKKDPRDNHITPAITFDDIIETTKLEPQPRRMSTVHCDSRGTIIIYDDGTHEVIEAETAMAAYSALN